MAAAIPTNYLLAIHDRLAAKSPNETKSPNVRVVGDEPPQSTEKETRSTHASHRPSTQAVLVQQ